MTTVDRCKELKHRELEALELIKRKAKENNLNPLMESKVVCGGYVYINCKENRWIRAKL